MTMLFNLLFRGETNEPAGPFSLRNTRFEEVFDHNKLAFILQNEKQIKEDIRRKARDEVELISYYNKSQKHNENEAGIEVRYYQPRNKMLGRYQAQHKRSGQSILREVRHTIFADTYKDLDIKNCHPTLLLWLCDHFSIPTVYLAEYVSNREKHISEILKLNPDATMDEVKAVFLSINNGGHADYEKIGKKTKFLVAYNEEMQSTIDSIIGKFPFFLSKVESIKKNKGKMFNVNGATISHVLQYIENQILMLIFDYVEERIGDDAYKSILCYDGMMILKHLYNDQWQVDLEDLFKNRYGINIELKVKEMTPIALEKYGFDPAKRYDPAELRRDLDSVTDVSSFVGDSADLSKSINIVYDVFNEQEFDNKLRKLKTWGERQEMICFRISDILKTIPNEIIRSDERVTSYDIDRDDPFTLQEVALVLKKSFVYVHNNGAYFFVVKTIETVRFKDGPVETIGFMNAGGDSSSAFKQDYFTVTIAGNEYTINLRKCLILCKRGFKYRNVDVIPHSPLEQPLLYGTFNLYGQYQHKYDPGFQVDMALVDLWADHIRTVIASNDPAIGDYLLNWFAHLLQFPATKTGTVPLIRGAQGCGKNIACSVFQRYVLNPSLTLTCQDMDRLFTRFNNLRMGKILIVLDEAVDSCDRRLNNKMKNFITEDRAFIEHKGMDTIEVTDFANYIILTNNDFASIVEKSDRRYVCLVASSKRVGDRYYFKNMANKLMNVDAGRHIFHWLLRRDLSDFEVRDIPKTEYKKELAARQTDNVVKWLLDLHQEYVDLENEHEEVKTTTDWYEGYTAWCRLSGESKIHSKNLFSSILTREGFEVKEEKQEKNNVRKTVRNRTMSRAIIAQRLGEFICIK